MADSYRLSKEEQEILLREASRKKAAPRPVRDIQFTSVRPKSKEKKAQKRFYEESPAKGHPLDFTRAEIADMETKAQEASGEALTRLTQNELDRLVASGQMSPEDAAGYAAETRKARTGTGAFGLELPTSDTAEQAVEPTPALPEKPKPAIPATTPSEGKDETPAEQPPSTTDEIMEGLERIRLLREEAAQADARAFEALQERQRLEAKRVEDEIASAEQDLKSYSIDPNRAYKSLGSQVAAAFAIALGAFAQGFTGGRTPNTALKIIEGAIARDVESQKAEMMKRKDVLKNKNNVYARMLSRFGNEVAAEKATTVLGLRSAIMQTQALIDKYPNMANKKVGLEAIARMEESRVKTLVELQKFQGRALRGQGKQSDTLRLFKQARVSVEKLADIFTAVAKESEGVFGKAKVVWSEMGNALGLGDVTRTQLQGLFDAQVSNASQSINKAFSGARGSDRDLAAVLMQMPSLKILLSPDGEAKGMARIRQISANLDDAIMAQGGLLSEDALYNQAISKGLKDNTGNVITEESIKSFMDTDEFKRIRDKVSAEESAQKKSPD
tara:strand:+ start:1895 stop:3568 length:1674 start_codon:yes stop_codon:yes gene_type:complete